MVVHLVANQVTGVRFPLPAHYMFIIRGKVRKGKDRGKRLGFPTANIALHKKIPEGIYVSLTKVSDKTYQSLTFIGSAKTFGETKYQAETYLFAFNKNLYGSWISIQLLKKIRDNQKFTSEKDLIDAMKRDTIAARKFFTRLH